MQVVLVMFKADGERRSFSLARDVTVIGRREDCDLRIPLGDVSRKHCRLIKDGDVLRLEDLGSSNGTFHNGVRVQEAAVGAGDTVQIGPVIFAVQVEGAPADEEIQAPTPVNYLAGAAGAADDGGEDVGLDEVADAELDEVDEIEAVDEVGGAAPAAAEGEVEELVEFDPLDALGSGEEPDPEELPDLNFEEDTPQNTQNK